MKNIKWACIQPLTGGFYLGAENAIGHPAEFILSYPGLDSVKYDKEGNMSDVGNEYNLLKYLEKHDKLPIYKQFNRKTFDSSMDTNVELLDTDWKNGDKNIDMSDIDLVVSVPVCSGLSQATIAGDDTKKSRNCNMVWNAKYALEVIKPKCYIFENAQAVFDATRADYVREEIEELARRYGYSITYVKTDTLLHYNCQRRPRCFVCLFKGDSCPSIEYENKHINVKEFFDKIPTNATQQITVDIKEDAQAYIDFLKYFMGMIGDIVCQRMDGH